MKFLRCPEEKGSSGVPAIINYTFIHRDDHVRKDHQHYRGGYERLKALKKDEKTSFSDVIVKYYPVKRKLSEVLAAILELFTVFPVDETIYEAFGMVSAALARSGNAIGDLDEVIATIALSYDGEIITRDRYFTHVPGLELISY